MRAQRQTGPAFAVAQPCLRRDVEPYIEVVLQHEGIDLNERSHAGLYHTEVERQAGPLVEGLTAAGGQELMDATVVALVPMTHAAEAESRRADTEFAPRYCRFNFDYRPRRN